MQQQQPQARAAQRPERLLPDDFWMFSYKVARCPLKHNHDWEKCVYAHDGEKARRRPPQCYSAVMCPEARAKKVCPRGEDCPCTHHLFEYWLHPDRYMTCLCELGAGCNRPICFFAHHPSELRPLPDGLTHAANAAGSSKRRAAAAAAASAAAAAAVQSGGTPSSSAPMGARQLSGGSLASSGGSHGPSSEGLAPVSFSTVSMGGVSMPQLAGGGLSDPYIRPGFSALGSLSTAAGTVGLSSSSLAAPDALGAHAQQQQQQVAGRAASTGSNACPSVLVLEAPPPVTMAPSQDLQLLQAAQQFSQLNLSAAATGWLSPTGAMAQSTSNMSLASSTSSTLGIGMAAEAQLLLGTGGAGTSTAMLLEAAQQQQQQQQQQLMQTRSISPSTSPMPGAMSPLGVLAGGPAGSSSGARLVQSGAAYSNLLRPAGNVQLAGTPVAMEETPEHLSFSLWDLDALGGGAPGPTQAQQLAARAQGVRQSPGASGLATPNGFGGFASRYGRGTVPAAAAVLDLAGAAADRLLQAQRAGSAAGAGNLAEPLLSPLGVGSDAETAKEARLTLLRAWVNAAAGAASGMSRSADGSSLQQQQDGVLSLGGATFQGGAVGAGGRVGGRGLAVVAQDMASVLAPAELLLLVQQLQGLLQNQGCAEPSCRTEAAVMHVVEVFPVLSE